MEKEVNELSDIDLTNMSTRNHELKSQSSRIDRELREITLADLFA